MNGSEKYILLAKIDTGTRNKKETVKNIELATIHMRQAFVSPFELKPSMCDFADRGRGGVDKEENDGVYR